MAFISLEDIYGQIECVFFPKNFENCKADLIDENIVKIGGRLQVKDNAVQIIADKVERFELKKDEAKITIEEQEYLGLIINENNEDRVDDILDILSSYTGNVKVVIAKGGKKFAVKTSVRRCQGLLTELKGILRDDEIIFFKKKS